MKKPIIISEPTKTKPYIKIDKGVLHISGNAMGDHWKRLFDEIIQQAEENPVEHIRLKLEYVDTNFVQEVFELLRRLSSEEKTPVVDFEYEYDDPELLELGEIMEGRLKRYKFNFIETR